MYGSHLSVAGGLHNALVEAKALELDCVQVFTKNQRQWRFSPLGEEAVELWREHLGSAGLGATVSHDSYLINLASPERETREKSIRLFEEEIERCERLSIPYLVAHPGSHMKEGEARGLRRVAGALDRVHRKLSGYRTITCLEVTAGQGTNLGHRFEHLARILDSVKEPERLAVCLDTAHLLAAGYDLTSARGADGVIAELDEVIGLELVRVIHVNDSKSPLGSRVDRHEHIGHGHVALEAFERILNHPLLGRLPKILETPKKEAPDGRPWDVVNLEVLRGL